MVPLEPFKLYHRISENVKKSKAELEQLKLEIMARPSVPGRSNQPVGLAQIGYEVLILSCTRVNVANLVKSHLLFSFSALPVSGRTVGGFYLEGLTLEDRLQHLSKVAIQARHHSRIEMGHCFNR